MKSKILYGMIILLVLQAIACGSNSFIPITGNTEGAPSSEPAETEASSSIGTVVNIRTQVYAGAPDDLRLINGETKLGNDDFVKVEDGGKARLTFPGPVSLLLYNQSELEDIRLEFENNSNPRIINKLIRGGFLGNVEPGSQQTIPLAFGVQVNILGTSFFILFDDENGVITVGKFDGTLSISIPDRGEIFVDDMELVDLTADGKLTRYSPLPFDSAKFDSAADSCASPIDGVNILRRDSKIPQPGGKDLPDDATLPCEPLSSPTATSETNLCETPVGYVKSNSVKLLEGPDLRFIPVGEYQKGDKFTVEGSYQGWYRVEFPDGNEGWLYSDWITLPPEVDPETICKIPYSELPPTPKNRPRCTPNKSYSCP